ncbi:MAG: CBS domain-containing protein [Syntrophorhabdaceae bacterium]|nr:CBS domain-containing protein [Syntrophorhabdaceae bacterium]MDD4196046.1 CBS domain-containing protein [Syntrophorhabdaceae bacterium]
MSTAQELLKNKSKDIWSVTPDNTVFDALALMGEKEIGALMVMDESKKVYGIISERDYARKVILKGKSSRDTKVAEIMTPLDKMFTVRPDTTVEDCMVLITAKRIRHVPVFDDDQFVGLISIGDVVKSIISEKDMLIEHLSNYIAGKYV